jgi:hypothetical protein
MGIMMLFLDTSFLNSCAHGLLKLNCYNHVFLSTCNYLNWIKNLWQSGKNKG